MKVIAILIFLLFFIGCASTIKDCEKELAEDRTWKCRTIDLITGD